MVIDDAGDDVMGPDTAVRWQEGAGLPLWRLSTQDRWTLAALCRTLADEVTEDPHMRRALLFLIRGYDLDHEGDG